MTRKELLKLIINDPESEIQHIDIDTYRYRIHIDILSENKECLKFEKMLESLED